MKKTLLITIVVLLSAVQVWSGDFTINVPYTLSKIPAEYPEFALRCWALCTSLKEYPENTGSPRNNLEDAAKKLFMNWQDSGGVMLNEDTLTVETIYGQVDVVGWTGYTMRLDEEGDANSTAYISINTVNAYSPNNVRAYVCGLKLVEEVRGFFGSKIRLYRPQLPVDTSLAEDGTIPVFITYGKLENPAADTSQQNPSCLQ